MKLKDIDPAAIAEALTHIQSCRTIIDLQNKSLEREIQEFCAPRRKAIAENTEAERKLHFDAGFLATARNARAGLPENVRHLRKRYAELRTRAASKKITVAAAERLRVKLAECERDLRAACPHPVILYQNGSEGSRGYDYDDAYKGEAQCIVCGFHAQDSDCKGGSKVLARDDTRVSRRMYDELPYDPKRSDRDMFMLMRNRVVHYLTFADADDAISDFFSAHMQRLEKILKNTPEPPKDEEPPRPGPKATGAKIFTAK